MIAPNSPRRAWWLAERRHLNSELLHALADHDFQLQLSTSAELARELAIEPNQGERTQLIFHDGSLQSNPAASQTKFRCILLVGDWLSLEEVVSMDADELIATPIVPAEFRVRLARLLREADRLESMEGSGTISFGGLKLDLLKRKAFYGDKLLDLTPTELKLVEYFIRARDQVLHQNRLIELLWPDSNPQLFISSLQVHINRLRGKLAASGGPNALATIRGQGYRIATETSMT